MADVFLAVARGPVGFNKLAVVKRLRGDIAGEASFLNMFLDEARLAARLDHPNVVHTYEVGEHEGSYCIAMEYLEGQPLNTIIHGLTKLGDALPTGVAARIVGDALLGLHHAHELADYDGTPLNIVHRDVSPHNVFVTYDGQVKLVDFGIAKAALSRAQTEVGVLKGKIAYMAPEQAMGDATDRRADLFAMGIVLWELVTRQRIWGKDAPSAVLHKLINLPVPRMSTVIPDIDPKLDAIVAKALEKSPDQRFQTAEEMREALERWIAESGQIVRQNDIGKRVSTMFANVRAEVRRQIQAHMAAVDRATDSVEIAALNAQALNRVGARFTASGSLPTLGSASSPGSGSGSDGVGAIGVDSGSGSGVMQFSPAGTQQIAASAVPAPKKRGASIAVVVSLMFVAVVLAAFVVPRFLARSRQDGAPSASIAAERTSTPTPSASAEQPLASAAPSATASAQVPADTASAKPKPAWMLYDAGRPLMPLRPTATATGASTDTPPSDTPTGPGFLTLDTVPWTRLGGGRSLGTTPIIGVSLSPGPHTLVLENPGEGIQTTVNVNIKSGEKTGRRLVLKQPQ